MFTKQKEKHFESIFISHNKYHNYGVAKQLPDDDYIEYKIWLEFNEERMMKKHFPNTLLIKGETPNIIFHGGCLGCKSQRIHGIDRCKGCQYFKGEWKKPDLRIKGEECDKLTQSDLNDLLNK